MSEISVLGLGAMGSRMASNLLKAGHSVTVWNRTHDAATNLVATGAKRAATPKEAATGADFVIAMVRDNEASREVWLSSDGGALTGMKKGALAIESSTLTPSWTRELGGEAAQRGGRSSEAEVATFLGVSPSEVQGLVERALDHLRVGPTISASTGDYDA